MRKTTRFDTDNNGFMTLCVSYYPHLQYPSLTFNYMDRMGGGLGALVEGFQKMMGQMLKG
jgi:hypothetical protein